MAIHFTEYLVHTTHRGSIRNKSNNLSTHSRGKNLVVDGSSSLTCSSSPRTTVVSLALYVMVISTTEAAN
ncbi:hypothetical protein H5410_059385 [Solanum commersonii]|uniref:Uncharacterized protein n=1 Tax=Solanum commersonii TaxID=4109 RepID=A0A9J5W279_SOLCO|nr:hypothetical protein H5410_059385 [Solanum commersonii]